MSSEGGVWRRRVFYIPGYDPFPPRRYRELYRKEGARQAALSGYGLSVGQGQSRNGWRVEAEIEGRRCEAEVEVLVWSDLVQASMGHGIVATYLQLVRTAWVYIASGALFRLARLRKGPTIAALYPFAVLLVELGIALGVGLGVLALLHPYAPGGWQGVAWLPAIAAVWLVLVAFRRIDGRIFAWYLMHDYAHSAVARGAYPADLRERLGEFAARIRSDLSKDWDEVLVVGHSSGAHMAVTVLSDVIASGAAGTGGPALSLLTLGQVVPMISFLPGADELRANLRYLSSRDEVTWVDVTAPGDGCAYALCDPVAVTGVAPEGKRWPLVLSAAFSQTLRPETWRALRRRYFRLHFQYLCAFDNLPGSPSDFDYFAITAGPRTLAGRLGDRSPSASRIERAMSPYRNVLGVAA